MAHDERRPLPPLALLAGMSGNLMEWYDFALYGVLASTLGQLGGEAGEAALQGAALRRRVLDEVR